MRMYEFDLDDLLEKNPDNEHLQELGSRENGFHCGGCLNEASTLFVLAKTEKKAEQLLLKGEAGLCGDCMCSQLLVPEEYIIIDRRGALRKRQKKLDELLPDELSIEQFDDLVGRSKLFTDDDRSTRDEVCKKAKAFADRNGGVVYTQVDTTPEDDGPFTEEAAIEFARNNNGTADARQNSEGKTEWWVVKNDNIAYLKGFHLVNRTGAWQVVLTSRNRAFIAMKMKGLV